MAENQKMQRYISHSLVLMANAIVNDSDCTPLQNGSSLDFWADVEHTNEYKAVIESNTVCSADAQFLLSFEILDVAE